MHAETPWHADESRLLDEVRQAGGHWARLPDIPGCTGLLEIGRGGQGVVYRARHDASGRDVAVKVLLDGALASAERRTRFRREIEIAQRLRHESIVRIDDSGTTGDGHLYCVMEFVDGRPLVTDEADDRTGPAGQEPASASHPDLDEQLALVSAVCGAVLHAHQRGVVHRDLKGSNILVDRGGKPRILDFGLAAFTTAERAASGGPTSVSLTGQILGSLPWASPEQLQGDSRVVDTRADIYALGVLLYRLTTGAFPHAVAPSLRETLDRIAQAEPRRPRTLAPAIPPDVEAITLRCLAKRPDDRYPTVDELQGDIEAVRRGEPIAARRQVAWLRARRTLARYRWTALGATVGLMVLGAVVVVTTVLYGRAADAERLASERRAEAELQTQRARTVTDYIGSVLVGVDRGSRGGGAMTVRELLDRAVARLPGPGTLDPLARAEIVVTLGSALLNVGAYAESEELLTEAVAVYRGALASVDEQADAPRDVVAGASTALRVLGKVRGMRGDLDAADRLQREAMELGRDHSRVGDAERTWVAIDRANLLAQRGRIAEAEKALESIAAGAVGAPRGLALFELGRIRAYLGLDDQAEADLRAGAAILERTVGASSIHAARCRTALAQCLVSMGRAAEARDLAEAALATHVEHLGETHQHVAETLEALAGAQNGLGEVDAAQASLERAVAICREVFGAEHAQTGHMLERLGSLLLDRGRVEDAERRFHAALVALEAAHPGGHLDCTIVEGRIAQCAAAQGRFHEAVVVLRRVVPSLGHALGSAHTLVTHFTIVLERAEAASAEPSSPESP